MNRHQRAWAGIILGILAGFAVLGLLFRADDKADMLTIIALLCSGCGLYLGLNGRRRCRDQTDRR